MTLPLTSNPATRPPYDLIGRQHPALQLQRSFAPPREGQGVSDLALATRRCGAQRVYPHRGLPPLRNPAVLQKPLKPEEATDVIQSYRQHPRWRVLGFPPRSRDIHAALWKAAATPNFARRRIYDLRIALCLQSFGVTEFATANVKDFEGLGFAKIWNPVGNS